MSGTRATRRLRAAILVALAFGAPGCAAGGGREAAGRAAWESIRPEVLRRADPRFRYERRALPDDRNAFGPWTEAAKVAVPFGDIPHPGMTWQSVEEEEKKALDGLSPFPAGEAGRRMDEFLARNERALALWDEGLRRGRLQIPEPDWPVPEFGAEGKDEDDPWPPGSTAEPIPMRPFKGIVRAKFLRGKKAALGKRFGEARDEFLALARSGRMLTESQGGLVPYLLGAVAADEGLRGFRWLAFQEGVPDAILRDLIREASLVPASPEPLEAAIRVDYGSYLRLIGTLLDRWETALAKIEKAPSRLPAADREALRPVMKEFFDNIIVLPETLGILNGEYARALALCRGPWREADKADAGTRTALSKEKQSWREPKETLRALQGWLESMRRNPKMGVEERKAHLRWFILTNPNAMGRIVLRAPPYFPGLAGTERRMRNERAATLIVLALRLRERTRGSLPEDPADLVREGFLPDLPLDAFTDAPLRYDPAGRFLWTSGMSEAPDAKPKTIPKGPDTGIADAPVWSWAF